MSGTRDSVSTMYNTWLYKTWLTTCLFLSVASFVTGDLFEVELKMPGALASEPDELICHSVALDSSRHQYILEYEPHASKEVAHHMMIYGCKTPASLADMWKCGQHVGNAPVCGEGGQGMAQRIVYAWALNAPKKKLPEGVGLRVGGDTNIQYMVLQLHYKKKSIDGKLDHSGVTVKMTYELQPQQMGFYILGSWGLIPPGQRSFYMESGCDWTKNSTIYPFAYRTHSHNLGRITSGYRIRDDKWTEIGRMSPQQPQMFYDVTNTGMDIREGDKLVARCTMNSMHRTEATLIGAKNHDEMCNFYFMYRTAETQNLEDIYCFKDAQVFHWSSYFKDEEIPENASNLEGVTLREPGMEPKDQDFM